MENFKSNFDFLKQIKREVPNDIIDDLVMAELLLPICSFSAVTMLRRSLEKITEIMILKEAGKRRDDTVEIEVQSNLGKFHHKSRYKRCEENGKAYLLDTETDKKYEIKGKGKREYIIETQRLSLDNLYVCIEYLLQTGIFVKSWRHNLHNIRKVGNDGAHGNELNEQNIESTFKQMYELAKIFGESYLPKGGVKKTLDLPPFEFKYNASNMQYIQKIATQNLTKMRSLYGEIEPVVLADEITEPVMVVAQEIQQDFELKEEKNETKHASIVCENAEQIVAQKETIMANLHQFSDVTARILGNSHFKIYINMAEGAHFIEDFTAKLCGFQQAQQEVGRLLTQYAMDIRHLEDQLAEKINQVKHLSEQLGEKNIELQLQHQQYEDELKQLKQELNRLLENHKSDSIALSVETEKLHQEFTLQIANKQIWENQISVLENKLKDLIDENASLNHRLGDVNQNEVQQLKNAHEKVLQEKSSELKQLENECGNLQSKLTLLQNQNDDLQLKLAQSKKQCERFAENEQNQEAIQSELNDMIQGLQNNLKETEKKLEQNANLDEENKRLLAQLQNLKAENVNIMGQVDALKQQIKKLNEAHQTALKKQQDLEKAQPKSKPVLETYTMRMIDYVDLTVWDLKIKQINVEVGDFVHFGDIVAIAHNSVVEIEITSNTTGFVHLIHVEKDEIIRKNDDIITFKIN